MVKKTRLKLENLRVESFVTSMDEEEKEAVRGGYLPPMTQHLCPITQNLCLLDTGMDCMSLPLPSQTGCPPTVFGMD